MTALEEGGVFDEETLPPWLQGKVCDLNYENDECVYELE